MGATSERGVHLADSSNALSNLIFLQTYVVTCSTFKITKRPIMTGSDLNPTKRALAGLENVGIFTIC